MLKCCGWLSGCYCHFYIVLGGFQLFWLIATVGGFLGVLRGWYVVSWCFLGSSVWLLWGSRVFQVVATWFQGCFDWLGCQPKSKEPTLK